MINAHEAQRRSHLQNESVNQDGSILGVIDNINGLIYNATYHGEFYTHAYVRQAFIPVITEYLEANGYRVVPDAVYPDAIYVYWS